MILRALTVICIFAFLAPSIYAQRSTRDVPSTPGQFGQSAINARNRPIFSAPATTLNRTSFGQVSCVQVAAREIQLRGYLRL
jgi:hypothetical protein